VPFDRVQGEEKPLTDLVIRESLGNKLQYFQLALAQWLRHDGICFFNFRLRQRHRLCESIQEPIDVAERFMILAARLLFNRHAKVRNRLSHWLAFVNKETYKAARLRQCQGLIEPLSQRELEILKLIAQGLSNHEISERLFLALDTVKGHNRSIYGKLQVQRRTEAIARARELGLL
jgi:ATP/maltotriose-dependent transcriptional regulator MalT